MAKRFLTVEFRDTEFEKIQKLSNMFPKFRAMALGYVGAVGRRKLKQEYMSGQYGLTLSSDKYPEDRKGKRTISYSIGANAKFMRIASYPLNLFEKGRKLRSGAREAGKFIMTRKFKQAMASGMQSIVNEWDSKYFQKELNKF